MITVKVYRTGESYSGFVCEGHAGYAEAGSDIVCAAVSALTINTCNSLERLTQDSPMVESADDGGCLKLTLKGPLSKKGQVLMDSLVLGLEMIEKSYGDRFLKVQMIRT